MKHDLSRGSVLRSGAAGKDSAMPAKTNTLNLITARFAGQDLLIERAYRHDATFRSLCEDYRDCADAIERLRKEDSTIAATRREEYTELLEELGCEIRDWLETHDDD
jgi:hypothetical protein